MYRTLISLAVLLASPALSQDAGDRLDGLFEKPGMGCRADLAGQPGGPVRITSSEMMMGGIRCDFTGITRVNRMDAELRDASCSISGKPVKTRFFMSRTWEGLTIVSEDLGTFIFHECLIQN